MKKKRLAIEGEMWFNWTDPDTSQSVCFWWLSDVDPIPVYCRNGLATQRVGSCSFLMRLHPVRPSFSSLSLRPVSPVRWARLGHFSALQHETNQSSGPDPSSTAGRWWFGFSGLIIDVNSSSFNHWQSLMRREYIRWSLFKTGFILIVTLGSAIRPDKWVSASENGSRRDRERENKVSKFRPGCAFIYIYIYIYIYICISQE